MRLIKGSFTAVLAFVPAFILAACSAGNSTESASSSSSDEAALNGVAHHPHKDLCDQVRPGGRMMRCHAKVRTTPDGQMVAMAAPAGLGPSDLHSAYKLPSTGGSGKTIAIVDANDNPSAESDLAVYRSTYGLSPCTTANGCFKKVNQNGVQGNYPPADSGWAGEIALDLDMASAVCPGCKILLVEANSANMTDLGAAVNMAVQLGATVVSNSYGGPEDASSQSDSAAYFNHPGVAITVSSGDSGYGPQFPASSQYVIAVGGTKLAKSSNARGWAEGAWTSAGSGCSKQIGKPSWQTDNGCGKRTIADVSAVADPNTGVAVYNAGAWNVYGGTSASAPIIAATYALLGLGNVNGSYGYSHASSYFDVTSGSNGSCGGSYLCTSGAGYDGPTGIGTPNGAALAGNPPPPPPPADAGSPPPPDAGSPPPPPPGTCAHPICAQGTKLTSSCDTCAAQICAQDSYCCNTKWDAQCVGEVGSICGQTCGAPPPPPPPPPGTCAHPLCSSGGKLKASCDTCAANICAQDPYCCNNLWDNICVSEVSSICGKSCP